MSKKKAPPGYPGDEVIRKKFGEVLRELRQEKQLSIEEVDALVEEGMRQDRQPLLPRALALVTRQFREQRKMSRAELSDASGVPLAFINKLERAKIHDITLTQVVRLAMALEHPVADFVEQIYEAEMRLRSE